MPPDGNAAYQTLQRPVTWEDTIRPDECCDLFFVPRPRNAANATYKFGEPFHGSLFMRANGYSRLTSKTVPSILHYDDRRHSVCKDPDWACSHWPAPLAIGTTHRPGPIVVWQVGGKKYVGLAVPKSGSTTLVRTARESEQLLNASFYLSRAIIEACAHQSYLGIVEDIERAANGSSTSDLPFMTGCGHAGTFDLNASEPAFAFAVVRDPITRFISALSPHSSDMSAKAAGYLYHKKDFSQLDRRVFGITLKDSTSVLEMLVRRAARIRSQREYIDDAHVRSQSYFLSSTDAAGRPILWDAIVRLEEASRFSEQLAEAMLRDAGLDGGASGRKWARTALYSRDQNSKRYGAAGTELRAAVLSHPTLACDLCAIYAQDFLCLGYSFPEACARSECLQNLPPQVARAVSLQHSRSSDPS